MNCESEKRRLRFMNLLNVGLENDCWEWQRSTFNKDKHGVGYGRFYWGRIDGVDQNCLSNRASWRIFCGEIPLGKQVLHTCNNRSCCNPRHLYLGDDRANTNDRIASGSILRGRAAPWCKRSQENLDAAAQMRHDGHTLIHIAKILGVSKATLHRWADADIEWAKTIKLTNKPRYRNVGPKKRGGINATS